jgi:hypothetical protein
MSDDENLPGSSTRDADDFTPSPNLAAGTLAGAGAALLGAIAWAVITDLINMQIGWMAVGIGFLVGFAVNRFGRGYTQGFALTGAVFSLLGCLLGNVLATLGLAAVQENVGFLTMLSRLTPALALAILQDTFEPMDLLFYGIAVYEGYKFSIRPPKE